MLLCAFIGVLDAVPGLRAFVFVTAVDFTSTNLVPHQPVGYAIVAMEEVRIQKEEMIDGHTDNIVKTTLNNNIITIFHAEILFQFDCEIVQALNT